MPAWTCPQCHKPISDEADPPQPYTIYQCPNCDIRLIWNKAAEQLEIVRSPSLIHRIKDE